MKKRELKVPAVRAKAARRPAFAALAKSVARILARARVSRDEKLSAVCALLQAKALRYDWVGFYIVDPEHRKELVLGPFAGEPTEHVRIPFGRGICGQAAAQKRTFLVDDVRKESNYLACSLKVKSEIVVPVLKGGAVVAELDIDSHTVAAFGEADRVFLEGVCGGVAGVF
jgi:GAF domain-containing protein